ncbi:MAG: c-type cytochrome [bacterium]|nr:c-type cytochrome [bacterium]
MIRHTTRHATRHVALWAFLCSPLLAQNGDKKGEEQPDLPADLEIPAAPVLSPEEQLATFRLEAGYSIELVAAEPLVVDPVAMTFDADGRLWVVEMRGYMPNIEGTQEHEPNGCIAVLTDTDGDERMDERVDFMSGIVLPRAVLPTRGGALVIAPPDLLFCRDTDGDGIADEREVISTGLAGLGNPEHAINGLLPTLDNWVRVANDGRRWRYRDGEWVLGRTNGGGQWGITKDDLGRVFFNTNPDPLRGDLFPAFYARRNPNYGTAPGVNVRIAHGANMATWPARINPGVNRGYRKQTLRDDFTLAKFTGACGPHFYRGSALGSARGNAFVCEPTGNLIKRYAVRAKDGIGLDATSVHTPLDFLTSTDERFRPVALCDGPDGALYIADFARGLIQHRIFLTTFLRKQIEARELEGPMGLGRIWRVVRPDVVPREPETVTDLSWAQLVAYLSHVDGWVRDAVQRTIIEEWEDDADILAELRAHAIDAESALGRMHALWTLEGIDWVTEQIVARALEDPDPRVLHAAVRLSEPFLATGKSAELVRRVIAIGLETADARLAHQVLLSLGEARVSEADLGLVTLIARDASSKERRGAVVSGVYGRELEFLERVLDGAPAKKDKGLANLVEALARCVARESVNERVARLVALAAEREGAPEWQTHYLMAGILAGQPRSGKGKTRPIRLTSEPAAFGALARFAGTDLAQHAQSAADALAWPGKPGYEEEQPVRPLTTDEAARFERGQATFLAICSTCHQATGLGDPGKAPPLRYQKWVLGSEERLVSILLGGLVGPLKVEGTDWNGDMPALAASPEDVAAVATYVRREWGHGADPVTPETVLRVIELTKDRRKAWTVKNLEARFPD